MMFPYPSAEGLHIGSVYTFTGIDVYGRYKAMQGFDVFEPFGLDGFGIHSENYALKIGENIRKVSARTEKHYYEQMLSTGNMIDWDRKLETYDPNYYKWTQWLFVQLFKAGLAYRKESDVNWCPSCKTVLSDEQVIDGHCERCNTVVVKKSMNQWFFKITDFAQRLLENLETLNWVDDVKTGQKNWIGMKSGIEIDLSLIHIYVSQGFRIKEPSSDLAVLLAIYSAAKHIPVNQKKVAVGEVSLSGSVQKPPRFSMIDKEIHRLGYQLLYDFGKKSSLLQVLSQR